MPMAPISIAAVDTPIAALLPYTGQFGLDTLIVTVSAVSGALWASKPWRAIVLPSTIYIACCAINSSSGQGDMSQGTIYLAQPALPHVSLMPPDDVGDIVHNELFRQIEAGAAHGADLIVLPELAFMEDLTVSDDLVHMIQQRISGDQQVLAGFPRIEVDQNTHTIRPYNSAMLIGSNGAIAIYDKSHLVPFGETMPKIFFDLGFDVVAGPGGGYGHGSSISTVHNLPEDIPPYALAICYEIMLSGAVSRETQDAQWLLNISAEGLFRGTIGPRLLLEYVRMRAIETGLPVLRSTAHAYSGVIMPDGSVKELRSEDKRGGVLTSIPAAQPTAFRSYGYAPLYSFIGFSIMAILAAGITGGTHHLRRLVNSLI